MDPNNVAAQFEGGYAGETNAEGGNNGGDGVDNGGGDVVALKKGPWTAAEDVVLIDYVTKHGEGNWNAVRKTTGLARCGKSCRLRWANHLRPNLKKGVFSPDEEELIIKLHAQFGNKWAKMASLLPGRTDNEIKNYWNTRIKRRQRQGLPLYSREPRHGYQNSPTTPTSLTAPTTPTGAAFQFQAHSHFPLSPTPQPHSSLTSPHPTTPTYNRLPLFNLASVSSSSSTPASSSFSFQRPTPLLSPTLGFKRFRSSTGSYSLSPSYSACQLDQSAATQMQNFEGFQLPTTLNTSSSSPMLRTQFDSDRVVASPTSIFPMKLELPSNQFPKVKEQEITFDNNFNNGTSSSQTNHGEIFGDLWYETQALPSVPYDFKKENSLFDEYRGLDDLSSLYWPNSSSGTHSELSFNEESPDMCKLMQGDLSRLLTSMPSSTQHVTEWFSDDQFSNGQSSFLTTDYHHNTFGLDMRPLNSLATLLPVASGSTHNETAAASYNWDNLPGLC